MRETGISEPWPIVTIELTTFQLQVIDDALEFARGEVSEWDVPPIDDIRDDIKKIQGRIGRNRSSGVPGFSILRRNR